MPPPSPKREGGPVGASAGGTSLRDRWKAVGATAKVSGFSLVGLVVIVTIVVLATGGGSRSPSATANAGRGNAGSTGLGVADATQTCAADWNAEASQLDRQEASIMASAGGTGASRAAAGYSASDGNCLITVSGGEAFQQYNESGGVFSQGATGINSELPGNWVWNAAISGDGTITAMPGNTGNTGYAYNTGNTGNAYNTGNTGNTYNTGNTGNTGNTALAQMPAKIAGYYAVRTHTSGVQNVGQESCPAGVTISGKHTDCSFAGSVRDAYNAAGSEDGPISAASPDDPSAGSITMDCTTYAGNVVACIGGINNTAIVFFNKS